MLNDLTSLCPPIKTEDKDEDLILILSSNSID